jgi:hypothetical protein
MYLKITNNGICHPQAFTILGVSTARGEENKIGQFGSGAKMGILTCLRHAINPVIVSGESIIQFDCVQRSMGEKKYDQVIAIIDGNEKELGFALEFGAIDWTKIDYAIREFVSNAKDQGGCDISVVEHINPVSVDSTSVYIEYTPEVNKYHENLSKYFLDTQEIVCENELASFKVYRKGVLVCEDEKQNSLFAYNIADLKVDESRNAETYMVLYRSANALRFMDEAQAKKLVSAFVNNVECVEVEKFDPSYINTPFTNMKIRAAWKALFGDLRIISNDLFQYATKKNQCVAVSTKAFVVLSNAEIPIAEIAGGAKGAKAGFIPIDITTDCKRIFNRVWKKVEALGLHAGKDKPKLAMFSKPMSSGSTICGYYDGGTVFIDRNHVNTKVVLEEIGHYVTDADDCTRDFQDWAFNVAGALL